jgi:hypothetical protein
MNRLYDSDIAQHVTNVLFYDSCVPWLKASPTPYPVTAKQTVPGVIAETKDTVWLLVEGPHGRLQPEDIAGRYPADGSTTSPGEFLPHIALRRRTLPWERSFQSGDDETPWLALLLLADDEIVPVDPGEPLGTSLGSQKVWSMTLSVYKNWKVDPTASATYPILQKAGYSDDTQTLDFVRADRSRLISRNPSGILPTYEELQLLCHVQELVLPNEVTAADADDPLWAHDANCQVSVVIGNRLPKAGQKYHACLVSVENRTDLIGANPGSSPPNADLIVLHHWSFTPVDGGDFEQLMLEMSYLPNGGVLSFGQGPCSPDGKAGTSLTTDGSLVLDANLGPVPGKTIYHGPLLPPSYQPPGGRSRDFALRANVTNAAPGTTPDDSYAAAFELGRMLACSDEGLLQDLHQVQLKVTHSIVLPPLPPPFMVPPILVDLWGTQEVDDVWDKAGVSVSQNPVADFAGLAAVTVEANTIASQLQIQTAQLQAEQQAQQGQQAQQFPSVSFSGVETIRALVDLDAGDAAAAADTAAPRLASLRRA